MNHVQQRVRGSAPHTDDWLITYADMITLLLCFFVIFFVILSSRKIGQEEAQVAHVSAPMVLETASTQRNDASAHTTEPDTEISAFNKFENLGTSLADEATARIGQRLYARPAVALAKNEPQKDRISMLEMSSSAFFDSGSANLRESGKSILRDVAVELKSNRYEGYQILVEGHTDDAPIATAKFSSNWELSIARATAVVHFFLEQGLPAQRLRAAGYADTRPKVPNRDAIGNAIPENQAQNRRVVIRLEKIETSR